MKVVYIGGSRRINGNTATILREFDHLFSDAKIPGYNGKFYNVAEMKIRPCSSCFKCIKKDTCIIKDDYEKLARKMIKSDLIIIGSPVYFSDVSAQIKALIDRTYSLWHKKALKGKKVILVANSAESGTGHTIDTMRHWAWDHEMDIIATVEGICEKKGRVLENKMTLKAIHDAVRDVNSIIPAVKQSAKKKPNEESNS